MTSSDSDKRPPAIWVDADACPAPIKQILFKAAERTGTQVTLIANHPIPIPKSKSVRFMQVSSGFDVADHEIVRLAGDGDLVVTQDIPLAAEVIDQGALVINTRGETLDRENVRARLNMRDFMDTMRSSGVVTGGPPPLSAADKHQFAGALDRWLARSR